MVKVKKELKAKNLQKENLEKWQASINGLKTETVSVPNETPQPAASGEFIFLIIVFLSIF